MDLCESKISRSIQVLNLDIMFILHISDFYPGNNLRVYRDGRSLAGGERNIENSKPWAHEKSAMPVLADKCYQKN